MSDPRGRGGGSEHIRRHLLWVMLCDAAAVTVLWGVARATRSRPSGATYSSIARVAAMSLAPGVIAVCLEERAHGARPVAGHRMSASALLFGAGLVINTVGTVAVLIAPRSRRGRRAEVAVDVALLIGGDVIGWPYLSLVKALHR
jgi:Kef-type K+ transport system membrane component KefB